MSLVNVFNEWDPIEEIVVGTALHAKYPVDDYSFRVLERLNAIGLEEMRLCNLEMKQIIEETEEDIDNFISVLSNMNIVVRRPDVSQSEQYIQTPDWKSPSYFCYCPRDTMLAIGDMVIESPAVYRSRYLENNAYKHILTEYLRSGSKWLAAPKPRLLDIIYNDDPNAEIVLNNIEPVFDAANILRCGRDIFYLISDGGNELGYQWLKNTLSDKFKVHKCANLYNGLHFDTTLVLLRPGLLLANPERVNKDNLPDMLKNWKILYAPEMEYVKYSNMPNLSSIWIGMNLLMLAPHLAVVDKNQPALIKLLEKNGITVIPLLLRHSRVLSGGFHCITLDTRRSGILEDYFI